MGGGPRVSVACRSLAFSDLMPHRLPFAHAALLGSWSGIRPALLQMRALATKKWPVWLPRIDCEECLGF